MTWRGRSASTASSGFRSSMAARRPISAACGAGEAQFLNLIAQPAARQWSWWGRLIFYESDVDALHARFALAGFPPDTAARDAEWGERFFHITDPDGHELSFAWPLRRSLGTRRPPGQ